MDINIKCNLREVRLSRGLSLRDMETKCKITRGNLSQFENNKKTMSIETAAKIALFLNCKIDDLYSYQLLKEGVN